MRDGATRREKVKRMCVCVSLSVKPPFSLSLSLNCLFFSLFFSRFPFRFARSPAAETHKQTLPVCVVCVFLLRSNRERKKRRFYCLISRFSQWSGNDSYPDVIVTWMVIEREGRERSIEEDTRRRGRKERVYRHIQQQSGLSPLPYQ